jgi:hypothetical protein
MDANTRGLAGFFEVFLRPVEYRGNFGEISRLSLMNNASCSLRQSKVQFCQFFGMNGAVFFKFGKGACGLSCARTFW